MDFDTILDRNGSGALKWNVPRKADTRDIIPLWVADMDFACPPAVSAALAERLRHPIFGYTEPDPSYLAAIRAWYAQRYGAVFGKDALLLGPGAVSSIAVLARRFCAPGEGVLVLSPVYGPFVSKVLANNRVPVLARLNADQAFRARMDLEAADRAITRARAAGVVVRFILFCSPHNPGGVVWTPNELSELIAFAKDRALLIAADEIHGDLILNGGRFTSLAGFPGAEERSLVFSSPNKAFNLAGLHISHFVVENPDLRSQLKQGLAAFGSQEPNVLSQTAAKAAYEKAGPWLDELLVYLTANADRAVAFINKELPGLRTQRPEGTYLLWVDASALIKKRGLADERALVSRLEEEARVRLTAGGDFGVGGEGFVRINIACPWPLLSEALSRLKAWVDGPLS